MSNSKPEIGNSSVNAGITLENCYSKLLEIYKARVTLHIALALATVTLTGYGFQVKRTGLFLLAAAVPLFALFVDLLVKYVYVVPFLYQAASMDMTSDLDEPTSLLLLAYGKGKESKYYEIFSLPSGPQRQQEFRRVYMRERLGIRLLFFALASLAEISFIFIFR